ncbi:helix-turn-helix domain-containing protein [Sphingomonas sp.]|uniref:helix-turn-helix domain-containing protein n=1 Tax=Sphingomonas sp. TaxID=28214 RepID=UPI003B002E23
MNQAMEVSGTVGSRLRAAREAQGRTIEEIGRQTRVPIRHLEQIEAGELAGLPAAPYSAGFVKAYARVVGLDPAALSQSFRAEFDRAQRGSPRVPYEPYEPADPIRLPPRLLAIVALVIAVLLVGGYSIWRSGVLSGEGPDARARLAAGVDGAPAPAPVAPAAKGGVASPITGGGAVVLTARDPVWVSITERGGAKIFLGVIDKGRSYTVPAGTTDPVIRLGKAEALAITVGGRPVAPLGPPATTLSNVSLKPQALLARQGAAAAAAGSVAPVPTIDRTPAPVDPNLPTAFRDANGR